MQKIAYLSILLLVSVTLSACQTANDGGQETDVLQLQGLWKVTGPNMNGFEIYEFGSGASGQATVLKHNPDSLVTRCDEVTYGLITDGSLYLDRFAFEVNELSESSFELILPNGSVLYTFEEIEGEVPVEPCVEVSTSPVATLEELPNRDSKLQFVGGSLLYTTDGWNPQILSYIPGDPYSKTTEEAEMQARYQTVIAAQDAQNYYVAEFAGRSDKLDLYQVSDPSSFEPFQLETVEGKDLDIEAGYYDTRERTLKVAVVDADREYLLLTVDTAGEVATDQTPILPGEHILDLTQVGNEVLALLGDGKSIARIGADGLATETLRLEGAVGNFAGIASNGPTIYLLSSYAGDGYVYTFTLD